MGIAIAVCVTVCEGREEAREATNGGESGGEVLVEWVAVAIVGEDRVEELEEEDCACWEEPYEVSHTCECHVFYGFAIVVGHIGFC